MSDSQIQQILTGHPAFSTLTEGVGRGFLLYFLPVTVLRRQVKKSVLRRSLAIGGFCGIVRLIRYYTQYRDDKEAKCFKDARNKNYNLIIRIIQWIRGVVYKYPCHVAGAIGALAGVALDPSLAESQLFSIWLLVRAVRCIAPTIPHAATAAMCISASQILSSYIKAPNHLDSSYYRFLKIHGGQGKETLHTLLTRDDITKICTVIHPGKSCTHYWFIFFFQEFRRAMKVYAPLYVVFFLFSRSKNITFLVQNLLRSSAFLALYCTLAWISGCVFHKFFRNTPISRTTLFLHASFSGLATLVERKVCYYYYFLLFYIYYIY